MKKIISLAALAAIFTLSSFVSGNSVARGPFNSIETMEVSGSMFNECTNEFVNYTGTAHANIFGMFKPNRIYVNYHIQYSLTGVGQNSGRTYHANMQDHYSESSAFRGTYRMQFNSNGRFLTSGPRNNFTTVATSSLTINSRGVTVSVEELTVATCQ